MDKREQIRKFIFHAGWMLTAACLAIYLVDRCFGDGDGVLEKYGLNPLSLFLFFGLFLLLFYGISSRKRFLSNISLSLLTFVFMLLLAEWGARIFWQTGRNKILVQSGPFPYKTKDPVFFKDYHPDCSFYVIRALADGGDSVLIRINGQGLRGPTVAPKDTGRRRVLLIGDSFIQALQVPFDQTIGQQLERQLPDSFEVIQHGFPSWSPLLECNWLLQKGMTFQPDQVLLFLYTNDFFSGKQVGDAGYLPYTRFDSLGYPSGFTFPAAATDDRIRNPYHLMVRDLQSLALLRWVSFRWRLLRYASSFPKERFEEVIQMPTSAFERWYEETGDASDLLGFFRGDLCAQLRDTSLWDTQLRERMPFSLGILKKMKQFLDQRGVSFGIVFIPIAWQFEDEGMGNKKMMALQEIRFPYSGLQMKLDAFCQQQAIPFLDLYAGFEEYKSAHPDEHLYLSFDGHWTREGHQQAAAAVRRFFFDPSNTAD